MLKISKLTDYALILLCELKESDVLSANYLSKKTNIPLATTNKILKLLVSHSICSSKNGKNGGYCLYLSHDKISVLMVIKAIEENTPHLTECSNLDNTCQLKNHCKISGKMKLLDIEIHNLLNHKFISDLL